MFLSINGDDNDFTVGVLLDVEIEIPHVVSGIGVIIFITAPNGVLSVYN